VYHTPLPALRSPDYEMWRACRLVVDTGHALEGLEAASRRSTTSPPRPRSRHTRSAPKVDANIACPGSARYKIGELEILELRRRAEAALGASFDIRAFHDAVLETAA